MTVSPVPAAPVILLDPGDFTPAYDAALQAALERSGEHVIHVGEHGFDEMTFEGERWNHFYPIANRFDGGRVIKGMEHAIGLVWLCHRLKSVCPSVIHMQWAPLPLVDRVLLPLLRHRAPLVITAHDSNPYNGDGNPLMKMGYGGVLRRADAVIVHTDQARARLLQAGVLSDRLYVIPHGLLHPPRHGHGPKAAPGGGRLKLLQLGKIKPYKGVDLLLDALALLTPEERLRLDVHIAGKPYMDMEPLFERIRQHGLDDCVTLEPQFLSEERMDQLLAHTHAAVFPYREIDASGVAMSAVSHGLPILASSVGGFAELFGNGDGAALVPVGDIEAIASILRSWIAEPARLAMLAKQMGRRRDAIPSWDQIAAQTTHVYERARLQWSACPDPGLAAAGRS
ncbi:MAG: glycosyltransferase [Geminicoccaceae bacterium]|nr:glycosyltransferase [Geminicoccaceae bacterium]